MSSIKKEGNVQNKMEDVLVRMPVGVAWANVDNGKIQFVNSKFISMFGYKLEDLTTVSNWIENCYVDSSQAEQIDGFWHSIEGTEDNELSEIEEVELGIRCKDGSIKTVLSGKIMLPHHGGALSTFLDITPRKEKEEIIKKQALEDPLTGLLNKRAFSQILKKCMEKSHGESNFLALLMLDLDGFKQINDSLGHDQGDILLKHVSERLKLSVRDVDSLCRIGGDEFCVVLDMLNRESSAEVIAERIIESIAKPFKLQTEEVLIGVSIGIANCSEETVDEDKLFKLADEALYRAKNAGRGRWSL